MCPSRVDATEDQQVVQVCVDGTVAITFRSDDSVLFWSSETIESGNATGTE